MSSRLKPTVFQKQPVCPSSEMLLAYGKATLSGPAHGKIKTHLASCDFCHAEVSLLLSHPPMPGQHTPPSLPFALRLLALRLLPVPPAATSAEGQRAA
ncbi:MAG: hypothetical protein ACR2GW_11925 [Pyrinomonadaceae bacterium]|nr:hypothetical protein [Pyrinomonadaceae bacterium]